METFVAIVGTVLLLLLVSITICVTIKDETMLSIRYGIFEFDINLDKEKPEKKIKPKKEKKTKKAKNSKIKPNEETAKSHKKKKKPIIEIIKEVLSYVKPIFNVIKSSVIKILKCIKIRSVKLKMFVASEMAHKTAIDYVKTKAVVSNTLRFLQLYGDIEIDKVEINADFISEKSAQEIYFEVSFRTLFILHNLIVMIIKIIIEAVKVNLSLKDKTEKGSS